MTTPAVDKPNPIMSYFTSIACKKPIPKSVEELVKEIQNPSKDVATLIASIRKASSSGDKKEATRLKKGLPAVTVSGIFEGGHLIANLKELNGLIQVDLDNVFDLTDLRNQLRKDPIILCEFLSPSGNGSKSIVRYTGNFEAAFHELTHYFEQRYSVTMDQVCKDVSRLMFLSHDPDCYYNPNAAFFKASNEAPKPEPKKAPEMPKSNSIPEGVTADVEKVVDQITTHKIDITGGYDDWLKLGFALASEFGLGGLGYFHKISQYSPTYDPHTCEKQYEACCRDTGVSKASIKTFFGMAKDYGLDIKPVYSKPTLSKNNIPVASKPAETATLERDELFSEAAKIVVQNQSGSVSLIQRKLNLGYNRAGKLMDQLEAAGIIGAFRGATPRQVLLREESELQPILLGIPVKKIEPVKEILPNIEALDDSQEMLLRKIKDTSETSEIDIFERQNGFFIQDSSYWIIQRGKGKSYELPVSNFAMEILFHFDDDSKNTRRLIKLQRDTGCISIVEVQDNETSPDRFEVILKSKKCTFFGNAYTLKRIFKYCMDNELTAKQVTMLGYNPDGNFYALSDSILYKNEVYRVNDLGVVRIGDTTYYLPAWSSSNRENTDYLDLRRFRYIEGNMGFDAWAKLVYEAYGFNGAVGIMFLINCLFRDIVFKQINFFPYLFLFGEAGVGKTTFIDILLRIFGDKYPGVSIKGSTTKAISRSTSQKKNAMLYLKEYDNTITNDLENAFKNFYDGGAYSTAQTSNDNKTHTWLVHSGIILDGNALPTKSSPYFDRNIILTFEANKFTKESTAAFFSLKSKFDEGFGLVLRQILSHRDYYQERLKMAFDRLYNQIKGYESEFEGEKFPGVELFYNGVNLSKLPDRTINHMAFLLTPFLALNKVLKFPFDFDELTQKVFADAVEKNEMMAAINDISLFWDSINYTKGVEPHRVAESKHFIKDAYTRILYIKMNELYPVYVDFCKKSNVVFSDKYSLIKLLTSESYKPFEPGDQKGRGKAYTKNGFGSCYRFRFEFNNENACIMVGGKEVNL